MHVEVCSEVTNVVSETEFFSDFIHTFKRFFDPFDPISLVGYNKV